MSMHDDGSARAPRAHSTGPRVIRRRPSRPQDVTPSDAEAPPPPAKTPTLALPAGFDAARRVIESVIVAVVTSTGLYLVGTVYVNAFYGRMSIDATALDFPPPYIALQSVHVVQSLLSYPVTITVLYLLYRLVAARLPAVRSWAGRATARFERLGLLIANTLLVLPLLLAALPMAENPALRQTTGIISEVGSAMLYAALALLLYILWLSLGRREFLLDQIRARKVLPIALLFALYLLDALVATAYDAAHDAELLMTGIADTSIAVSFTPATGVQDLPTGDLLLVAIRNGHYFVVARQPIPPSLRPIAHAIPVRAVDAIQMQQVNPAISTFDETLIETPTTPAP